VGIPISKPAERVPRKRDEYVLVSALNLSKLFAASPKDEML
jgi:hypothetical protein